MSIGYAINTLFAYKNSYMIWVSKVEYWVGVLKCKWPSAWISELFFFCRLLSTFTGVTWMRTSGRHPKNGTLRDFWTRNTIRTTCTRRWRLAGERGCVQVHSKRCWLLALQLEDWYKSLSGDWKMGRKRMWILLGSPLKNFIRCMRL